MTRSSNAPAEAALRDALAQGDLMLGTIAPVLGHLLANHDHSLFSDEVVSRVRGMIEDLACQLLAAEAEAAEAADPRAYAESRQGPLTAALLTQEALVAHCHALALEWQLTSRLEARHAIDPVLSPLLQALVASDDDVTASSAMATLAAQARFVQRQRRMELPLGELPADHFGIALATWTARGDDDGAELITRAADRLRTGYDESAGRLGLLARLVHQMGPGGVAGLSISHAGPALFLTALAAASRQNRDTAVVATNDQQTVRLALSLRAAGLKPKAVEEQFLYIHPGIALPEGFDTVDADRAQAMLSASLRGVA